ncbi:SorC family transcriptional regulator [Jeotgalibaca ciconiae]|uniref:SorC family transcriptional regulator n=2 Tax=Jeotgalibaca ciconiae TaxID=2496265 RepID=A0A3Q9BIN7_9LACT|nr:SorC family transcriptional regulator [Jeotgalibaca ciconiae]
MTNKIETRGFMKDSISVLQKIVPDLLTVLHSRYRILKEIQACSPIGRRALSEKLNQSERTLRTETDFLRKNGIVSSSKAGMELTHKGKKVFYELESIIDHFMKMNAKEEELAKMLKLQLCRIVPGNLDDDSTILDQLGIAAVNMFDELLPEGEFIVAVAGGSTMAAMAKNMTTELSDNRKFTFVPSRGGLGEVMSIQANSVSDLMAQATGGENTALFAPDNLSAQALDSLKNEPTIRYTMNMMKRANCLLYSIGNAKVMMERRKMSEEEKKLLTNNEVVGEAFGCYFDEKGTIISRLSRFGLQIEDVERIPYAIAIAGGELKAKAIKAYSHIAPEHTWLVTDEGAANLILKGDTL